MEQSQTGLIVKVDYEINGEKIELTANTVKRYLVNGSADRISSQEVGMFLMLCKGQKLNPFLREAYLVKYGDQPAQMIVGKDAFSRRAEANENYKGAKSGVIVVNLKKEIENREGTFYLKGREELVGGWARITFKNDKEEVFNTVSLDEYIGKKKDGSISSMWLTKPATMIRKVALVQALREAFPNTLSQMYTSEEMGIDDELPVDPIDIDNEQRKAEEVPEPPKMVTTKSKQLLMSISRDKGLVTGEGKQADITKLDEFAKNNGFALRNLTEVDCENLMELLKTYEEPKEIVQDADFTPVDDNEEDPF